MERPDYSAEINELIDEIRVRIYKPSPRLYALINRLERQIPEEGDLFLSGSCFFYRACGHYSLGHTKQLFSCIRQAVYYLLRSDDRELLARAYNLFAIEAQRLGCYDVAYHYLHMAYSLVADRKDSYVRAIIDSNMGDLLTDLGDVKRACVHIRRNLPVIRRSIGKAGPSNELLLETLNLGLHCIYAADYAGARRMEKQLARRIPVPEEPAKSQIARFYLLFRTQMALVNGDRAQTALLTNKILQQIVLQPDSGVFTKETYRLCKRLIAAKEHRLAGKMVSAFEQHMNTRASAYAKQLLAGLQIDYYTANGNRKKMLQCYETRNALLKRQLEDEMLVHNESIALMHLAEELYDEQERVREANDLLREQAETDALTRLPNRYALNRRLESAFTRAVKNKTTLGIGVVDIDCFKQYNDTKGHKAGDRCLAGVGSALQALAEEENLFCARYGGDEFVLVYENKTDTWINRFERRILQALPVSVTHGFYNTGPTKDTMLWSLFSNADHMLYSKKRKHRPS